MDGSARKLNDYKFDLINMLCFRLSHATLKEI